MPKGPLVHEIFSSQSQGKNMPFSYDGQESMQGTKLVGKSTFAPQPPGMKRFGGYKPKILNGQDANDLVENRDQGISSVLSTANLNRKSRPAPTLPAPGSGAKSAALTKPKAFIVGDKNVPMVLSTGELEDGDSNVGGMSGFVESEENRNEIKEVSDIVDDLHIYHTVIDNDDNRFSAPEPLQNAPSIDSFAHSETSTLISSKGDQEPLEFVNHALEQDDTSVVEGVSQFPFHSPVNQNGLAPPIDTVGPPPGVVDDSSILNGVREEDIDAAYRAIRDPEVNGVYIPEPDYEEEEKTITFDGEDTDASDGAGEEARLKKHRKSNPVLRTYEGADLSHFLTDDEDREAEIAAQRTASQKARKSSASSNQYSKTAPRPKVNQRNSLFKQQTQPKRKGSSKVAKAAKFSSVRSFSYADSKFGTQGKAAGKNLSHPDDQVLVDDSYESFLRSRHGDAMPLPDSSDSGVDMADYSSLHRKQDPLWKKFTLRLKNKKSRDFS